MPRHDAEDLRRRQLVSATLDTIAEVGFGAATLTLIGQRAGVSAGLIAHYFGDKDGLLEAALRSLAARLSRATTERLRTAPAPRQRIQAVIEATLAPEEFEPRSCGVWLAFWGQVNHSARLRRIQTVYQRRMLSNLRHALRALVPEDDARRLAMALAAMIDGLWLRASLSSPNETDSATARAIATAFIDGAIARAAPSVGGPDRVMDTEGIVERAVAVARAAQPGWATLSVRTRGAVLRVAAARLAEDLPGSPDAASAADCLARQADMSGIFADAEWPAPSGLVGIEGSAEMSLATLSRAVAPALAAGNAVIVAPDPTSTRSSAAGLGATLAAAGLPSGLFSALPAGSGLWPALRGRSEVTVAISGGAGRYRTTAV